MKKLIPLLLIGLFLTGCSVGKYDGLTAEEWFNEYDNADAENQNLKSQISDLEYERDEIQTQYDDIQYELDDLESEYDNLERKFKNLKDCIMAFSDDPEFCYYSY